jgi:asparagine synthase (glutamine-hydrolysing)
MCGLAGFFGKVGTQRARLFVSTMLQAQEHRGPDATGIWSADVCAVDIAVGLVRLKILDLSDAANQPMISDDGRYVLVYNGEIYNYLELRGELADAGALFRTHGDTEAVLHALVRWGAAAFTRFNGMWAIVLLDKINGEIMLARDRFGIKPLYTYSDERGLFVSSEIKAILKAADKKLQVNANAAGAYLQQSLLCADNSTFFAGINEFPAGHWVIIQTKEVGKKRVDPQRYWAIPNIYSERQNDVELIEKVRETFIDAVRLRLRSDVPVGVLLSGGIDSSAIAATVHHLDRHRDDVTLISAVAKNGKNDEQPFIDMMAHHLKRSVEKVVVDYPSSNALDMVSEVTWFNDEPIGSFSTVAHYLLMKKARDRGITVLLSGQGADEILCGYKKYLGFYLQELISTGHLWTAAQACATFMQKRTVVSQFNYREAKRYLPRWLRFPETDVRGPALLESSQRIHVGLNGGGVIGRQVIDVERLSVPALVHYEDRMSMSMAREIRLPFLDYRLVSLLVPLPVEYKLRDGWTKWIFRRAMETLLPKEIAWRKDKQHFIVPQNEWFRWELREEVLKLLEDEWITEHLGLINRDKLRARYNAYLRQATENGRLNFKDIFAPIALELWARCFESYLSA